MVPSDDVDMDDMPHRRAEVAGKLGVVRAMAHAQPQPSGEHLWHEFVEAEKRYYLARMRLFKAKRALLSSDADMMGLVKQALDNPPEWGTALRLLLELDEPARRVVFPTLLTIAANHHANVQLAREVILSLDRQWVLQNIPPQVERILEHAATDEEYRGLAEVLRLVQSPSLAIVVERAALSDDADIREVATDFGQP
jgi:hypothetical protein